MPLSHYITAFSYFLQQTHKAIMQVGLAWVDLFPESETLDSVEIIDATGQLVVPSGKDNQMEREQGPPAAPLSQNLVQHMAMLLWQEGDLPLAKMYIWDMFKMYILQHSVMQHVNMYTDCTFEQPSECDIK